MQWFVKLTKAYGVLLISLGGILLLAVGTVFGLLGPHELIGAGPFSVSVPGLLVRQPSESERTDVARRRTEAIERGEAPETVPAHYPMEVQEYDSLTGRIRPVQFRSVHITYNNAFSADGTPQQELFLLLVETAKGAILVPEPETPTPPIKVYPELGRYVFEDNGGLWTIDAETMNVTQITRDTIEGLDRSTQARIATLGGGLLYWATSPVLSPDGHYIAYFSNRSRPTDPNWGEVWVVDLNSGAERRVFSQGKNPIGVLGWTPDGSLLVRDMRRVPADEPGDLIEVVSLNGSVQKVLMQNVDVLGMSQTGEKIIFSRLRPYSSLSLLDVSTGAEEQIADLPPGRYFDPTIHFSPDGRRIVGLIVAGMQGEREIFIRDIESKNDRIEKLPFDDLILETPQWIASDVLIINSKNGRGATRSWLLRVN